MAKLCLIRAIFLIPVYMLIEVIVYAAFWEILLLLTVWFKVILLKIVEVDFGLLGGLYFCSELETEACGKRLSVPVCVYFTLVL